MGDVNVKEVRNIDPVTIATIKRIDTIAPVAVHIKELNQVGPLLVESARIDALRNIDPLTVDALNVTRLPVVNLSVNQVPNVEVSIARAPPLSIGVHQRFELPSSYTARARFLGFEVLRLQIEGCTQVIPRDTAHREQAHVPQRSFPDVAAVGNPAIPTRRSEQRSVAQPPPRCAKLHAGPPRFQYRAAARPGLRPG